MMSSFLLNPLSAQAQFNTADEARQAIRDMVECLKYLSPAISSNRHNLIVDASLEYRSILNGYSLIQTISNLPNKTDRDTRISWFLYTRKKAIRANAELVNVTIASTDPSCNQVISESSTKDFLVAHSGLISFGGSDLTKSKGLRIHSNGQTLIAKNAHMLADVRCLVPSYNPSPKHRKEPYYDYERREQVAAMPLPPDVAHEVLLSAVPCAGDYVGLHGPTGKFIRFKLTGGNEYHGFEVAADDVPLAIRNQLKPEH